MSEEKFLRRKEAGEYLASRYGFCSPKSLGKLATLGGGPRFYKAGYAAVYKLSDLDEWAREMMGAPVASAAEAKARKKNAELAAATKPHAAA